MKFKCFLQNSIFCHFFKNWTSNNSKTVSLSEKLLQFIRKGILQRIYMQNFAPFAWSVKNSTPARLKTDEKAPDPPFWIQLPVDRHKVLAIDKKLKHKWFQGNWFDNAPSAGQNEFSWKLRCPNAMAAVSAILERKYLKLRTSVVHALFYIRADFERRMMKNADFRSVQMRFWKQNGRHVRHFESDHDEKQ